MYNSDARKLANKHSLRLNRFNMYLCAVHNECFTNDNNDVQSDMWINRPKQWYLTLNIFYGREQHEIVCVIV